MTVTYKWFRLAKDELIKDELKAEIYTKSECESNAKWPFKIEGNKRKCIPLLRTLNYFFIFFESASTIRKITANVYLF